MKQVFKTVGKILTVSVVILSFASCTHDDFEESNLTRVKYTLGPRQHIDCSVSSMQSSGNKAFADLNDFMVHWEQNDVMRINNAEISIDSIADHDTVAYFSGYLSPIELDDNTQAYISVYPAKIISSASDWGGNNSVVPTIKLPARQNYCDINRLPKVENNYMAAYTVVPKGTEHLRIQFKNLCAMLRIGLRSETGETQKVSKICLYTSNSAQTGFHGNSGMLVFQGSNNTAVPTIQWDDRNSSTHEARNMQRKLTLDCTKEPGGYVSVGSETKYFLMMVPINVANGLNSGELCLEVYNEDSTKMMRKISTSTNLKRSYSYNIDLPLVMDREGFIDADFSISSTKVAKFSKGNLQWLASINGTDSTSLTHQTMDGYRPGMWRFALHQYDLCGNSDKKERGTVASLYSEWEWNTEGTERVARTNRVTTATTEIYSHNEHKLKDRPFSIEWIDLFNFGTSGYVRRPWVCPNNSSTTSMTGSIDDITNTNFDWGYYNAISNGGNKPGMWRLFDYTEWGYILRYRTNALRLIGFAQITDAVKEYDGTTMSVNGCVLLPDNFVFPNSTLENAWTPFVSKGKWNDQGENFAKNTVTWTNNQYSIADWKLMEAAGALFFPATGFRVGAGVQSVQSFGDRGYAFSGSRNGSKHKNRYFYFGINELKISYDYNLSPEDYYGRGVRLAQDW